MKAGARATGLIGGGTVEARARRGAKVARLADVKDRPDAGHRPVPRGGRKDLHAANARAVDRAPNEAGANFASTGNAANHRRRCQKSMFR